MAETVIAATLELDSSKASKSIKEIKSEISEATLQLKKLQAEFGATSDEAIKTSEKIDTLKGSVEGVKKSSEESDPFKMFDEFKESVEKVTKGVRALNDTMALLGMDSKQVEAALKKVESAMEFAEKIKGGIKGFVDLKNMALDAFKSIKAAIGGTGIGVLVLALGAIYTYWDDIKTAIGGVNSEQQKNLDTATANASREKEKLDHIDDQDNILKSQGKSEKEILELKSKQVQKTIAAAEAQLNAQKVADTAAQKAAENNRNLLTGLLKLVTAPLQDATLAIDALGKKFGKDFGLNQALNKGISSLATLVFDPEGMKQEADKSYKEQEEGIDKIKNKQADYRNQMANLNKQEAQKREAFRKELQAITREGDDAKIEDAHKLAKKQLSDQYEDQKKEIKQSEHSLAQKNILLAAAKETYNAKDKKLDEEFNKEAADRESAALEKLKKMHEENLIESIADKNDQNKARIEIEYQAQKTEIENFNVLQETKNQMLAEALDKRTRLLNQNNTENTYTQIEKLKTEAANEELSNADRFAALQTWSDLIKNSQTLTEEQKTQSLKENSEARKAIEEAEFEHKQAMMSAVSGVLKTASAQLGEATIAGKVLAVAAATIDTWAAVAKTLKTFSTATIPGYAIAQAIAVGAAGMATVKKIISVPVPKSSGGAGAAAGMPNIAGSAPAPVKPELVTTRLPQDQINQIGNATVRAYVVEQDIDQDRSRTTRLNRAARLGG